MTCQSSHRYWGFFDALPFEQGTEGRHKCCGCAYELGYNQGVTMKLPSFDPATLPFSQAGSVRHKSVHAAFAQGYYDGITEYYRLNP
ncbi:hypothetical protein [Shewanella algae]|uniref:hypothetical protein n=1 Tax=Shewanella algae TaxID=38313 RepID=UPI0011870DA4|nr:hypothetical protein [Shewanella algae]BCV40868.1 hypothetical protein TUM17378_21300 [Shewanella algae]